MKNNRKPIKYLLIPLITLLCPVVVAIPVEVTLEGGHNGDKFPVLHLQLQRGGHDEGRMTIRFPEMIEATVGGKVQKFYQDNRDPAWPVDLACEPVSLPVSWKGTPKALQFSMPFDNGMILTARAKVDGSAVSLQYRLENQSGEDLGNLKIWSCIQLQGIDELRDPLMERTMVHQNSAYRLMRDVVPDFVPYPEEKAVLERFMAFMPGIPLPFKENPYIAPHPGFPDDPEQSIYFWQVTEPIDQPVIATQSKDAAWSIITTGEAHTPSVWSNPGISCHHADAVVPVCNTGDTATLSVQLAFIEGAPAP